MQPRANGRPGVPLSPVLTLADRGLYSGASVGPGHLWAPEPEPEPELPLPPQPGLGPWPAEPETLGGTGMSPSPSLG